MKYIVVPGNTNSINIGCINCNEANKLSPNTIYDWQLRAFCNSYENNYSDFVSAQFQTTQNKKDNNYMTSKDINNINLSLYPNPYNNYTNLNYTLPTDNYVNIELYNILGFKIADIIKEKQSKGQYNIIIDLKKYNLSKGVYIIKLTFDNVTHNIQLINNGN